jgi:putative aldouronate transport system substrate-binding protein
MPTNQDEFVEVLRAFKEQDANGNGDPDDEIPTSGREGGRWMDYLFGMYGVAMGEGYPLWDIYDGELTYSGVTENMKDAIVFIKGLYEEGLLDSETFLNSSSDWKAKITSDRVGIWYHLGQFSDTRFEAIKTINPEATFDAFPNISADGYEGFITHMDMNRPEWVIANKDEETIINALTLLDFVYDPDNRELNTFKVEGVDYEVVDGKKVLIAKDQAVNENIVFEDVIISPDDLYYYTELERDSVSEDRQWAFDTRLAIEEKFQDIDKTIAGDGLPNSIFEGYSDIQQHTLYQEYMTNIIIGEWPIEKFDEFVELWYQTGGEEVTNRAREWYEKVNSID